MGGWTDSLDRAQLQRALSGADPFDETTMVDSPEHEPDHDKAVGVHQPQPDAAREPATVSV